MIKLFQRKRDDTPESRTHEATKVFFKYMKTTHDAVDKISSQTQALIDKMEIPGKVDQAATKVQEVSQEAIEQANQKIATAVDNAQALMEQHKPTIQASQDAMKKIEEMRKNMFSKEGNDKTPKKK